ncbi:MAG TPA: histidine kinase [Terriglobales bacterium]|nr:histidine kinase [Terriglobales bacterium]
MRNLAAGERHRVEIVLATARVLLAGTVFAVITIDPTEPSWAPPLAYRFLFWYLCYSVALLLLLRTRSAHTRTFLYAVQVVDIAWPTVISLFTEGPNPPFFLFYVFVLFAAAYRWGMRETLATTFMLMIALVVQASVARSTPLSELRYEPFEPVRVWSRAGYLLIIGLLAGYLGEQQRHSRDDTAAIARLIGCVRLQDGFKVTVSALLDETMRIFRAQRIVLISTDRLSGRSFLWDAVRPSPRASLKVSSRELTPHERVNYTFSLPSSVVRAVRRGKSRVKLQILTGARDRLVGTPGDIPPNFVEAFPFSRAVIFDFALGDETSSRAFLLDNRFGWRGGRALRFLHRAIHEVGPAIHNIYLLRRLRREARAVERARMARDLHDGVVQSLFGIEMRLHLLRKQTSAQPAVSGELLNIQHLVHNEFLNLRELVQEVRALDVTPERLLDFLAETVEKFGRETGIEAQFVCETDHVDLPPRHCREIARIVHEGLVNVRKHSGARNVIVRLNSQRDDLHLVIEDNGDGFDFSGTLDLDDLDRTRKGPLVIKERVRSMAGSLKIDSTPGRGSRLEITLAKEAYEPHAATAS